VGRWYGTERAPAAFSELGAGAGPGAGAGRRPRAAGAARLRPGAGPVQAQAPAAVSELGAVHERDGGGAGRNGRGTVSATLPGGETITLPPIPDVRNCTFGRSRKIHISAIVIKRPSEVASREEAERHFAQHVSERACGTEEKIRKEKVKISVSPGQILSAFTDQATDV
jgi:hypothetical protein